MDQERRKLIRRWEDMERIDDALYRYVKIYRENLLPDEELLLSESKT